MPWPQSTEYHEAVQNLRSSVSDEELRGGRAAVNPLGLPLVWSGNFADVYKIECPATGNTWALKCFTREVAGQRDRYRRIAEHLERARLPFMVDFDYLEQGIRVRGQWFPALKMRWVTGLSLNQFVEDHLDRPKGLKQLLSLWVKLAARLREAEVAHADLQHGNVLLVPHNVGQLALRLIDYDGMYVPELAGTQSGEVGHPAYQHPQRLRDGTYNAEVDRFSHLAIYSAIRSLTVGRADLWRRFSNGENLLFTESDFSEPGRSEVFHALWDLNEPNVRALVGRLALACRQPLEEVPLLGEVLSNGSVVPLSGKEQTAVASLLGEYRQPVQSRVPAGAAPGSSAEDRPWWSPPPPLNVRGREPATVDLWGSPETATAQEVPAEEHADQRRVVQVALNAVLTPVRSVDALLRKMVGPEDDILHNFLRFVTIVALVGMVALGMGYCLTPPVYDEEAGPLPPAVAGREEDPQDGHKRPARYTVELLPEDAELTVQGEGAKVTGRGGRRTVTVTDPDGKRKIQLIARKGKVGPVQREIVPVPDAKEQLRIVLPAVYRVGILPGHADLKWDAEGVSVTKSGNLRIVTVAEPDRQTICVLTATMDGFEALKHELRPIPGEEGHVVLRLRLASAQSLPQPDNSHTAENSPPKKPFEDLDKRQGRLPIPKPNYGPGGNVADERELAKIYVDSPEKCNLSILGSEEVLEPGKQFKLVREDNRDGSRTWDVQVEAPQTLAGALSIGAFRLEGNSLTFRWNSRQPQNFDPNRLRYCVLEIKCGELFKQYLLGEPEEVDSLRVDVEQQPSRTLLPLGHDFAPQSLRLDLRAHGFPKCKPEAFQGVKVTDRRPSIDDDAPRISIADPADPKRIMLDVKVNFGARGDEPWKTEPYRLTLTLISNQTVVTASERLQLVDRDVPISRDDLDQLMATTHAAVGVWGRTIEDLDVKISRAEKALQMYENKAAAFRGKIADYNNRAQGLKEQDAKFFRDQAAAATKTLDGLVKHNIEPLQNALGKRQEQRQNATRFRQFFAENRQWCDRMDGVLEKLAKDGVIEFRIYIEVAGKEVELVRSKGF